MLTILLIVLFVIVYSWTFYNLPVLIVGIKTCLSDEAKKKSSRKEVGFEKNLPTFSIVVPAKNEETVLPRLLNALLRQNYPREKLEIIVVEDGSTDGTVEACKEYVDEGRVRIIHSEVSNGKPSALNRALKVSTGDIIAVFDADSIPEQNALFNAAKHFQDKSIAALQGRTLTLNSDVNMLTKFVSYEETLWYEGYLKGKDTLNLFVHLKGSCQFIRRNVLVRLGGWSEKHLSEDMEISARLTEKDYRIKYASDVRSWQESPENLTRMFRQRTRWFRGSMEVALTYGRLIKKPSLKILDAEATLFGPFVLIISLLSYILSPLVLYQLDEAVIFTITLGGWATLTATLIAGAVALLYVAKPKRIRDTLWLPFIYAYWSFQAFLATWALIKILFKAPKEWKRTPKTGAIAVANLALLDWVALLNHSRKAYLFEATEKLSR